MSASLGYFQCPWPLALWNCGAANTSRTNRGERSINGGTSPPTNLPSPATSKVYRPKRRPYVGIWICPSATSVAPWMLSP